MSTHNLCFRAKIKKYIYYIKVGCRGYKAYGHVIVMQSTSYNMRCLPWFDQVKHKPDFAFQNIMIIYKNRALDYMMAPT